MKSYVKFIFVVASLALIGAIVSWIVLYQVRLNENRLLQEKFSNKINSFLFTLQERYSRNETLLEGTDGFFIASNFVSVKEWEQYIASLNLQKKFPGIQWISFVKYLPSSEKETFVQTSEYPSIAIWPDASSSIYAPIIYIGPTSYQNLLGYNLYSDPSSQKALNQSIQNKTATSSNPVTFQPTKVQSSERFLYYPIFKSLEIKSDPFGWIVANIDFSIIIEKVAKGTLLTNIDIEAFTGNNPSLEHLFFEKKSALDEPPLLTDTKTISFAGAEWTFRFKANPEFKENTVALFPFFLLLFVPFILLAFFLYFRYFSSPKVSSDTAVTLIENIPYSVIATDLKGTITYINQATEKMLGYKKEEMINKMTPESIHDPEEMKQRAKELSTILAREIKPNFEVFTALSQKEILENRRWVYLKKDQTKLSVQLCVSPIKDIHNETIGYLGIAVDAAQLKL